MSRSTTDTINEYPCEQGGIGSVTVKYGGKHDAKAIAALVGRLNDAHYNVHLYYRHNRDYVRIEAGKTKLMKWSDPRGGVTSLLGRLKQIDLRGAADPNLCADYPSIPPQNLLRLLGKPNVAVVNTVDDDKVINLPDPVQGCCFGKNFKDTMDEDKLSKFEEIVLYCANDTCNASHKYANELLDKHRYLENKILLYKGGVYEWALLSFAYPRRYGFYSLNEQRSLDRVEVESYFKSMAHRSLERSEVKSHSKAMAHIHKSYPKQQHRVVSKISEIAETEADAPLDGSMSGKVCVVTGGTSGLGLAVARRMLEEGCKHVTLTYFHDEKRAKRVISQLCKDYGEGRFKVVKADARTEDGNKLVFDKELRIKKLNVDVGPVDCVDVNAGIFGPASMHRKHVFNISVEDYKKTMDTNLTGYFLALKYFSMQARKHNVKNAAAVCIKSIYGSTGSLFSNIAYQTSKHGVMGLVRQAAIELARANNNLGLNYPIRVNAVSPTFTTTALTKPFLENNIVSSTIKNDTPSNQLASKRDVAEAVLFLLSDRARSITGIDLPVDGGVLAESIPTYKKVQELNDAGIEELSCCGESLKPNRDST